MKKYVWLIALVVIVGLFVVGCFGKGKSGKDSFVVSVEDNIVHLKCKKAVKGASASATITIEEDEELVIRTNLEKLEKVNIKVYPAKNDDSTEPLVDLDGYGVNPYSYPLDPGAYEIKFTALNEVNGSIDISAE